MVAMATIEVKCPICGSKNVIEYGKSRTENYYRQGHVYPKKTKEQISTVNLTYIRERQTSHEIQFDVLLFEEVEGVELDEMWSFVFSKENQRWLWLALDHQTRQILAYTFGRRKDEVFRTFQAMLEPFSISMFYTDDWGSYQRNIHPQQHVISKKNTQIIERKNLTLRTHIKRLCRKSICFSKSVVMHDIVIGLTINIWEFGMIYAANNSCRT